MAEIVSTNVLGLSKCGENYELDFYCPECNRLYCGKCSTKSHRGTLKGHDVEDIEDTLARRGFANLTGTVGTSIRIFNLLSKYIR